MADIPNLAGVATSELAEKIGSGNFQASYINWSRTLHLLRTHAPGWMPETVPTAAGTILHDAPQGGFLLLRFRHVDGTVTPEVPQAVMGERWVERGGKKWKDSNFPIPHNEITARDITDTHRRGVCMAAALTFGLAYELWAKLPLESGYAAEESDAAPQPSAKVTPLDGAWESQSEESQKFLLGVADNIRAHFTAGKPTDDEADRALSYLNSQSLMSEEKNALWTQLHSGIRSALKRAHERAKKEAA